LRYTLAHELKRSDEVKSIAIQFHHYADIASNSIQIRPPKGAGKQNEKQNAHFEKQKIPCGKPGY
jgi:hypothetical protein